MQRCLHCIYLVLVQILVHRINSYKCNAFSRNYGVLFDLALEVVIQACQPMREERLLKRSNTDARNEKQINK